MDVLKELSDNFNCAIAQSSFNTKNPVLKGRIKAHLMFCKKCAKKHGEYLDNLGK